MKSLHNILLCLFVVVATCSCSNNSTEYIQLRGVGIGTTYNIIVNANKARLQEIRDAVELRFEEATLSMSIFDTTSRLSQLNGNKTNSVDNHIEKMIRLSTQISQLRGGYYDCTVKPLVEAWGFVRKEQQVKEPNVDSLLQFVGYTKIAIENGRLIKSDPRVQLDFNSIAKGYTVDLIAQTIETFGITDYMVEVGGEVRCQGKNSRGTDWRVGIDSPFDSNNDPGESMQVVLQISGVGLATSGNYRRYYIDEQGRKIAHTINPKTGESAISNLLSATIIAPTSAEADALGTMCMSLGVEESKRIIGTLAPEVQAYLIYIGEDNEYEVWYSQGVENMIVK